MHSATKNIDGQILIAVLIRYLYSLFHAVQNISERNINIAQALAIHDNFHFRHSYGKPICSRCRQSLKIHYNLDNIRRHEEAFELINIISSSDESSTDDRSDDVYVEPKSNFSPHDYFQSTATSDNRKRELLHQFLNLCGSDKSVKIAHSYHSLRKQSKANFLSSARNLIQHVLEFLARDDWYDVRQELLTNNGNFDSTLLF